MVKSSLGLVKFNEKVIVVILYYESYLLHSLISMILVLFHPNIILLPLISTSYLGGLTSIRVLYLFIRYLFTFLLSSKEAKALSVCVM